MHGMISKPPGAAANIATSRVVLLLLVVMTGIAPISLYMLVPALPVLATNFGSDISVAQMTVSLYMVGIALSQLIMGPLSDRFGRRPVLLGGLTLMVAASIACIFAQTLPQLIAARFFQALGGASRHGGQPRHHPRYLRARSRRLDDQPGGRGADDRADGLAPHRRPDRDRVRLARDLLRHHDRRDPRRPCGIAVALPETRRTRAAGSGFRGDVGILIRNRAFVGYVMCQVLASQIIFTFVSGASTSW